MDVWCLTEGCLSLISQHARVSSTPQLLCILCWPFPSSLCYQFHMLLLYGHQALLHSTHLLVSPTLSHILTISPDSISIIFTRAFPPGDISPLFLFAPSSVIPSAYSHVFFKPWPIYFLPNEKLFHFNTDLSALQSPLLNPFRLALCLWACSPCSDII